ncbi:uncharacterized protein EAF01_005238 [Botrytis porri]|uniref:uncharacterized protein n=1 Tax=Botrytis porri TaxID=87229 RepID=UPI001902790F|nr:uncharacterized protein EAF01_005238 [Botrytis porri]KAF7907652.1 hypothetical protein EAF01_005238 [Botrytis porri]
MPPQALQPSSPSSHPHHQPAISSSNTPLQPIKPATQKSNSNHTPPPKPETPSPFLLHALRKKAKKDLKAAREEERKKSREMEEGKKLFGGEVAEVLRVWSELKLEHPDVPDSVLEQEAWKLVFY